MEGIAYQARGDLLVRDMINLGHGQRVSASQLPLQYQPEES